MTASAALAIVVVFGTLIFIHEFGHFILAKRAGVQVDEFALGFGPRLFAVRRGETEYTLRIFPLGGFVRMAGMYPQRDQDVTIAPPGRGFNDKTVWQRMAIVVAGPVMNLVLAAVLLILVLSAVGVPRPTLMVEALEEGRPAAVAGLRPGDRVVAIDDRPLKDWLDLQQRVGASPGRDLTFLVRRDGQELTFVVRPEEEDGRGFVGIHPAVVVSRFGLAEAVPQGVAWTIRIVVLTISGLAAAIQGEGASDILGPVGIGQQIGKATRLGLNYLMVMAAVLSANLGLLNLLPIPALDGSRLVFLFYEAVRGRPLDQEKENWIHAVGFALLMALLLTVTYRDLLRLNLG